MSGLDNTSETVKTVSGNYTVTNNDYDVLVIGATGAVAITLPAGSSVQPGRFYRFYKDSAAQTITITPVSGTIDGGSNVTLASGAVHAKGLLTDGTNWFTVSSY